MVQRVLIVAVAFVAACSPFGGGAFSCERDDQCGATGKCTTGFCSFLDSSCASGYRFGEASGSLANTCVADGAPTDGNGGTDGKTFLDAPGPDTTCYGTGFGKTCFKTENVPSTPVTLTAQNIDTSTSALCSNVVENNPGWCVIAGTDLTITGIVTATGAKPLVLIATNELHVDGTLDVASHRVGAQIGAGAIPLADTTSCDPGTPPNNNGGGAGGSFGAAGGDGGNNGGNAGVVKPTNAMRGGCAGQDGKSGTFGVKGFGGGVTYLIANVQISVGGAINASGAAGSKGVNMAAGGGGGGSGGLIALDAPIVTNGGAIFANGGGGAEGSSNGNDGFDGNEPANGNVAAAADGGSNGGGGGAGGGATAATDGGNAGGFGGGGGGGGAGAVKLFQAATITGGVVSPPPS